MHMISSDTDPDLAFVAEHWHDLPDDARRNILHVVKSYTRTPDEDRRREACLDALQQAHSDNREGDRTYEPMGGES